MAAVALVTGASSGVGQRLALRLAREGFRTFGTSRRPQADVDGVEMLPLNVRSDTSVADCVTEVLSRAGSIDILVNNAGVLDVGPAEERTIDEAKAVLETNFYGAVRMTHAVLPSMRDRGAGRIINVGSLAGLLGPPGQAFYAASKFALEGYSEALSHEVAAFGIHVTIVEPGFLKTGLGENAVKVPARIPAYDRLRQGVEAVVARGLDHGTDPDKVVDVILHSVRSRRPRLRYRVGRDARWLPRVRALIPERMFSAGMKREFRLP